MAEGSEAVPEEKKETLTELFARLDKLDDDFEKAKETAAKTSTRMAFLMQDFLSSFRVSHDDWNTVDDAVELVAKAERIVVVTGAGISVSAGIPDFRSKTGIYSMVKDKLEDPHDLFNLDFFLRDPTFYFEAKYSIWPQQTPGKPPRFKPTLTHEFLAELDKRGKLLRNYTQNIDTLERIAGVSEERVIAFTARWRLPLVSVARCK